MSKDVKVGDRVMTDKGPGVVRFASVADDDTYGPKTAVCTVELDEGGPGWPVGYAVRDIEVIR